jgi:hypothetical protein
MTLSFNESNALSTLQTIVATIQEVDELRSNNDRLVAQQLIDEETKAVLYERIKVLEDTVHNLTNALEVAQAHADSLTVELTNTKTSLAEEQRLAGQHWNDLTNTRLVLCDTEYNLATVTFDRNRTAAKLTEAEEKLGKFRDILGIAHPVESAPEPLPVPAPVVEASSASVSEPVTIPYPLSDGEVITLPDWNTFKAQPEEAESVEDYPYRDAL